MYNGFCYNEFVFCFFFFLICLTHRSSWYFLLLAIKKKKHKSYQTWLKIWCWSWYPAVAFGAWWPATARILTSLINDWFLWHSLRWTGCSLLFLPFIDSLVSLNLKDYIYSKEKDWMDGSVLIQYLYFCPVVTVIPKGRILGWNEWWDPWISSCHTQTSQV